MAVLHHKEEKIQAVLGRLPKKYSPDDFVAMFIKLYSKDWGKIKSAYIKASQDKEPGTVIHMPKPDLYLKQILEIFLTQKPDTTIKNPKTEIKESKIASNEVIKSKAVVKKAELEKAVPVKKTKVTSTKEPVLKTTKAKAAPKDAVIEKPEETVKKVRVVKKKVD